MTESTDNGAGELICPAATESLVRKFVMAVALLGYGLYCFHDIMAGKYDGQHATLMFNWACGLICVPLGAFILGKAIIQARTPLIANQSGIGYSNADPIEWSSINTIVVRGKGLMDLHYEDEGESGILKLDSLNIKNFTELTAFIEQQIPEVPVENVGK